MIISSDAIVSILAFIERSCHTVPQVASPALRGVLQPSGEPTVVGIELRRAQL
jgi:hypothetical protein